MNEKNKSELTVITRAKECYSHVLQITDLAPKKYRYALLGKSLVSYNGHLKHGHTYHLRKNIINNLVLSREREADYEQQ